MLNEQQILQQQLKSLQPNKKFFVGIDSDGCVFDTMEIKHKECFCPNFIRFFELQMVSKYAREVWEFVNLYSKTRGYNRFLALSESIRLLGQRREVILRKAIMPDMSPLETWTRKETKLGNPALKEYAIHAENELIDTTLAWSEKVNSDIEDMVKGIAPFPYVQSSLERVIRNSDVVVVSQTPLAAIEREWKEHDIDLYVRFIAGQEHGTKTEHLALAAKNKYPDDHILMIGDALGDLSAAKANGVLFYPINPGHEEDSWERLHNEGLNRFYSKTFTGSYQDRLIQEFHAFLPEKPKWD